jgi:hypothetical protein
MLMTLSLKLVTWTVNKPHYPLKMLLFNVVLRVNKLLIARLMQLKLLRLFLQMAFLLKLF